MKFSSGALSCAVFTFLSSTHGMGASAQVNPVVKEIVDAISTDRIAANMKKLESFGTRDTHSEGNVKARQWLLDEFKSYSPRLQVRFDIHPVKKRGRIVRDLDVVNVIAVLPGSASPERQVMVSGHYDSLAIATKKGATPGESNSIDAEASAVMPRAPGVSDDASGVAAVLELARVMSSREFEKTVVFAAFGAEEQGLIGSTLFAQEAHKTKTRIEAVLNNDIIGNDRSGSGIVITHSVRVFSADPADSASRSLARYIYDTAPRYVPSMRVELVFRSDRFSRGGDHTPFSREGFAAVRFTTPAEALDLQHTEKDNFEAASPAYTARVTKVNAAALASLALAPKPPDVERLVPAREPTRPAVLSPNLSRGKSRYDAVLRWKNPDPETDLLGYAVVIRSTTSSFWEREIFVGNVQEYTLKDFSIDDVIVGVKAVDKTGIESLVSAYVMAAYQQASIDLN